jgi:hypothetical protein
VDASEALKLSRIDVVCLDNDSTRQEHEKLNTPTDQAQQRGTAIVVSGDDEKRQRIGPLLVAIIAGAVILRVLFLGKSLWLDEGVAFANAWAGGLPLNAWGQWIRGLWQAEFNMVFYFALLRVWLRLGNSEAFIRLLSVIPAIATIPVVYALGKRIFSARVGVIAALLLACHGAHVSYSQEARGYTLVVFLSALSTYFFITATESGSRKVWFAYWAASTLAIYSHLFGGLVIAAHWISLIWVPRRKVPWRALAVSAVAIIIAAIPSVLFAFTNKGQQIEWIPKPGFGQLLNVLSEFAGNPLVLPVYVVLWVFGLRHFLRPSPGETRETQPWHAALIVSWLVVPFAIAAVVSFRRPVLVPRYLLISVPAAVLLAGVGAMQIRQKTRVAVLWVVVVLSLAFIGYRYTRPRENWRDAAGYVLTHAAKDDAVLVVPWWSEQPFGYYLNRASGAKPDEIRTADFDSAMETDDTSMLHRRLWLVVYARPQGLNDAETRRLENALSGKYRLEQHHDFRLVQVRLYALTGSPEAE